MSVSIELARYSAAYAYQDATGPMLYGFVPFFKSMTYPVAAMLKEIKDWVPIGVLVPRFSCVNQEASDHFLDIKPSTIEICQSSPTGESIFITGHNHIFICPRTWTYDEEPFSPDKNACLEVRGNRFTRGYPRYRSNVILDALVSWRLQAVDVPVSEPSGLNSMVALNARDSFASPRNYDAYMTSKCLRRINLRVIISAGSGEESVHPISRHQSIALDSPTFNEWDGH